MTFKKYLFPPFWICLVTVFASLCVIGIIVSVADSHAKTEAWSGTCPVIWDNGNLTAACGDGNFLPLAAENKFIGMMLEGRELDCKIYKLAIRTKAECN